MEGNATFALTVLFAAIFTNNIEGYRATTSDELTLYEWFITPHRLDGLDFHEFMMREATRIGTVFGSDMSASGDQNEVNYRFDLANLHIQHYSGTAIASYTLLVSSGTGNSVQVAAHNESRVMVEFDGEWKVVHVHKSPGWPAPHLSPAE